MISIVWKVFLALLIIISSHSAFAALRIEVSPSSPPYRTITLVGTVTGGDWITDCPRGCGGTDTMYINIGTAATDLPFLNCNGRGASASTARSWLNSMFQPPGFTGAVTAGQNNTNWTNARVALDCVDRVNNKWIRLSLNQGNDLVIKPPAGAYSTCSLNSQNLNLNYSSTNLNVNGLTQSTNLTVSCTVGAAQDYQLRLTGTNVTNGRLNFGNGVSAQVSLNGTQVSANGSGIRLNSLTSLSIPIRADLIGTATNSGTTTASGVLILDAL